MSRMLTITAYQTEQDFNCDRPELHYEEEGNESQAWEEYNKRIDSNYWLVTLTNEDGKLLA